MVNTKKITGSTLALVVVSVLLVMSLTLGITLAWFNASATGNDTIKFAETFTIAVTDGTGAATFNIFSPGDDIIPGSLIALDGGVKGTYEDNEGANVPFLLRIKFDLTVSKDGTSVTSGGTGANELEEVYQAFYDSVQAGVEGTFNWIFYEGYFYYIGAEADVTYTMTIANDGTERTGSNVMFGAQYAAATQRTSKPTADSSLILTSVYTDGLTADIPFMTRDNLFRLSGSQFTNAVAGAEVTVMLTAQAVQDSIYAGSSLTNSLPNIVLAKTIFDEAFGA